MKQIAVYGKGGIGKSTITANLSAALSKNGLKVLQIGCDPKHDSTKLILGGIAQVTVLEKLKSKSAYELHKEEIVLKGYGNIDCIEAGGPEPGVGCAGRGIITMAKTLDEIGFNIYNYDYVIYDVLGDVVCGGFAVPMRQNYSDEVYIVTSGEIMSLYAANNICKGLVRFGGKLGGIIFNARNIPDETITVNRFTEAVKCKIVARFNRDNRFIESEKQSIPIIESFPESELAAEFFSLASIIRNSAATTIPEPLTDRQFEDIVSGWPGVSKVYNSPETSFTPDDIAAGPAIIDNFPVKQVLKKTQLIESTGNAAYSGVIADEKATKKADHVSKAVKTRDTLHCCSLAGAVDIVNHISDAMTIIHSPASCAGLSLGTKYMTAMGMLVRGLKPSPNHAIPKMTCTNLTETDLVYGAEDKLEQTIRDFSDRYSPGVIFLISSCPSAIIGDDILRVASKFKDNKVPVIAIASDGIMEGDYSQGTINAYKAICDSLISKDIQKSDNPSLINIIGEEAIVNTAEENFNEFAEVLKAMGLTINNRFIRNTTVDSIRNFNKAPLSIRLSTNYVSKICEEILKEQTGTCFLPCEPPIGFKTTLHFLNCLSEYTGKELPESLIDSIVKSRKARIDELKPIFSGKRVLLAIFTSDVSWVVELSELLEFEIAGVAMFDSCMNIQAGVEGLKVYDIKDNSELMEIIQAIMPDLLLANYLPGELSDNIRVASIPIALPPGVNGSLRIAEKWAKSLTTRPGEWRADREVSL